MEKRIFVSNIPFQTTAPDLKKLFGTYGAVTGVNLLIDKKSGPRAGWFTKTVGVDFVQKRLYQASQVNIQDTLENAK